jgi:hypothetical protein
LDWKQKPIFFYFFRNKKKRKDKYVLHTIFVFHNKNLQPKYIIRSTKKGTGDQQQKKGTGDQQINKKGSLIFFLQNFLISKKTSLASYQNKEMWD